MPRTLISLIPLLLLACGGQKPPAEEDAQALAQLQGELHQANAVIDSLNYTVDTSNQIIDGLRAQVSSLQKVDARLYNSVQALSAELRNWRTQADEQQQRNQAMSAELERLKKEQRTDKQTITRLRREADSLNTALFEANGAIHRQMDQLDQFRAELAQARGEVAQARAATSAAETAARQAQLAVHVFPAGEQFLREQGYLEAGRKMFRKSYKLVKALDHGDPHLRQTGIGQPLELEGDLKALADRYGRLREGNDYSQEKLEGRVRVTFTNPLLQGTEVLAVVGN
ncbi:MAG: hypothetical protein HYW07_17765 [Candidatus Latescibacteria bacterium]|nr:hypothetical protein [Candidatus Latescibacterota bacterium]